MTDLANARCITGIASVSYACDANEEACGTAIRGMNHRL